MLTKNFYNAVMGGLTNSSLVGGGVLYDGTVCDIGAFTNSIAFSKMHNMQISALQGINVTTTPGVRIGSGDTPATVNDINLESMITSGLSVAKPSGVSVSRDNECTVAQCTYGITNTSQAAITISEIGLFCQASAKVGNSSSVYNFLFDRTVLEKPIVINPGESKQLTYTIRFNYPVE